MEKEKPTEDDFTRLGIITDGSTVPIEPTRAENRRRRRHELREDPGAPRWYLIEAPGGEGPRVSVLNKPGRKKIKTVGLPE